MTSPLVCTAPVLAKAPPKLQICRTGLLERLGLAGVVALTWWVVGCQHSPEVPHPDASSQPGHVSGASPLSPASSTSKQPVQELTPELIRMSEKILEANGEAPVGQEFPFDMNGRRYLARIEEHEDAVRGVHKGVTLYHLDER